MAIIRPNTVSINTILHTATASITNKAMISDSSTVILRHQQDGLKPDWRDICIRDEQSSMPTYPAPSSTSPFFSLFLFLFFFFFFVSSQVNVLVARISRLEHRRILPYIITPP